MQFHKINPDIKDVDFWCQYLREHPELRLSFANFSKLSKGVNEKIMDLVMRGNDIELLGNLGHLGLRAFDGRTNLIDWQKTKDIRKEFPDKKYIVYVNNEHTNWQIVKFFWLKKYRPLKNKYHYTFKPTRLKARELAARLKNPDIANNFYRVFSKEDSKKQQEKYKREIRRFKT